MAAWQEAFPILFTADGDKTNQAIQKHITEINRIYSLLNVLRVNFSGAGFPAGPERNQLFINPNTLEAKVYVGINGPSDWRPIVSQPGLHALDTHTAGLFADLQALVTDAILVTLGAAPTAGDNGKVLMVNASGGISLSVNSTPKTHSSTHTNGTDDIQSATTSQKGLMSANQATKLGSITLTGGTTGQVLSKKSATDYDTEWVAVASGGGGGVPTGGTTGQVLAKSSSTDYATEWKDASSGGVSLGLVIALS